MTAAVLGVVGVVGGFGVTAIYLAITRGKAQVALAEALAEARRVHAAAVVVDQAHDEALSMVDAQEVVIYELEQLLSSSGGDSRNAFAAAIRMRAHKGRVRSSADSDPGGDVRTEPSAADPTGGGEQGLFPRSGLLERLLGTPGLALRAPGDDVDGPGDNVPTPGEGEGTTNEGEMT